MRFIFVSFSQSVFPEIVTVADKLQSLGHETVYWIGSSEPTSFIDEKGDSGLMDNNFLLSLSNQVSLDAEDVRMIADKEPHIFDFLQRTHPKKAFPELERIYHTLLLCSKWLILEKKPDVIVFRIVPNMPPLHFILYSLARAKGIKTVIFSDTWVKGRVLAMNDFTQGTPELKELKNEDREIEVSDLSEDFQEYYNFQTKDLKRGVPVYMPSILNSYNLGGRAKAGFRALKKAWEIKILGKMWKTLLSHTYKWIQTHSSRELPRAYKKLSKVADFEKPFIYFPLHLQPEFSTNPLGGYFRDQILVLELLVTHLPKNWFIYIKEHPTQWPVGGTRRGSYRPKDYYRKMARFPNVRLVPVDTDSFKLIRNSKAVATVSGTAAWESTMRGKPSLVFGYPWFMHAPGIFVISNSSSCKDAMKKIEMGEKVDAKQVLSYLKRLDDNSFKGCLDLSYRNNPEHFTTTFEVQAEGMLKNILRLI
ncbi:MAG: hypothetical protein QY304_02135 [Candidatus Paceibacterota bacterium]|nr:MAG: hypothetical protein QY304_02135 [Candidatus Paceibacterota bacterium]